MHTYDTSHRIAHTCLYMFLHCAALMSSVTRTCQQLAEKYGCVWLPNQELIFLYYFFFNFPRVYHTIFFFGYSIRSFFPLVFRLQHIFRRELAKISISIQTKNQLKNSLISIRRFRVKLNRVCEFNVIAKFKVWKEKSNRFGKRWTTTTTTASSEKIYSFQHILLLLNSFIPVSVWAFIFRCECFVCNEKWAMNWTTGVYKTKA